MANIGYVGQDTVESAIERLKAKGAIFAETYNRHLSLYDKVKNNPAQLSQWQSLKNKADYVKGLIQTVNNSVDKSVNWLRDVFGFQSSNLSGMNEVGVLPLIPIAYVLAAITALTYVVGDLSKFYTLVSKGATTEQLTDKPSIFSDTASIVKWGGIAFGLYLLYKKFGHHLKG